MVSLIKKCKNSFKTNVNLQNQCKYNNISLFQSNVTLYTNLLYSNQTYLDNLNQQLINVAQQIQSGYDSLNQTQLTLNQTGLVQNVQQLMFQDFYFNLTQQFKQINFQIVNMDEFELFRDYTSTQFNYPFIQRNTIVSSFDLYDSIVSFQSAIDDYNFNQIQVNYQISQVCLEDPFYSDIDIYNKISNEYQGFQQL